MHGHTNMKFIDAKQAKGIYQYQNTKRKLYRTTAAIWYNETCRDNRLTPKYISIKVKGNNKQSHYHDLKLNLDNIQSKQKELTKKEHNPKGTQFYQRTINLTKIKFTKEEEQLLNHGLQHSIE